MSRIVVALGGNALGSNAKEQLLTVKKTARRLVDLVAMGNEVITLIKDTSLANVIAVTELMFRAQQQLNKGLIWPIFYAGLFYFLFNALVTYLLKLTERKLEYIKI